MKIVAMTMEANPAVLKGQDQTILIDYCFINIDMSKSIIIKIKFIWWTTRVSKHQEGKEKIKNKLVQL